MKCKSPGKINFQKKIKEGKSKDLSKKKRNLPKVDPILSTLT